jgi:hypothetical protein
MLFANELLLLRLLLPEACLEFVHEGVVLEVVEEVSVVVVEAA